jgi:hypothetical protein
MPGPLDPLTLDTQRGEGGQLLVRIRLSTGLAGWCYLPAGEMTDELLAELAPRLERATQPPGAVSP